MGDLIKNAKYDDPMLISIESEYWEIATKLKQNLDIINSELSVNGEELSRNIRSLVSCLYPVLVKDSETFYIGILNRFFPVNRYQDTIYVFMDVLQEYTKQDIPITLMDIIYDLLIDFENQLNLLKKNINIVEQDEYLVYPVAKDSSVEPKQSEGYNQLPTDYLLSLEKDEAENQNINGFENLMISRLPLIYSKMPPHLNYINIYTYRGRILEILHYFANTLVVNLLKNGEYKLVFEVNNNSLEKLDLIILRNLDSDGNFDLQDLEGDFEIWYKENIRVKYSESDEPLPREMEFEFESSFNASIVRSIDIMLQNPNNIEMISQQCKVIYMAFTIIDGDNLQNPQRPYFERELWQSLLSEIKKIPNNETNKFIIRSLNSVLEDLKNDSDIKEQKVFEVNNGEFIAITSNVEFENVLYIKLPYIYSFIKLNIDYIQLRNLILELFQVIKEDFNSIFPNKVLPVRLQFNQIKDLLETIGMHINRILISKDPQEYSETLEEIHSKILPKLMEWSENTLT